MKRLFVLALGLSISSCTTLVQEPVANETRPPATLHPSDISVTSYGQPFGHAPDRPDLGGVFISLPDELAADMPLAMRQAYIKEYSTKGMNHMFDPRNRFAEYYNDNAYNPIRPSSIFYVKVLPSERHRYLVFIHMVKPSALDVAPRSANTFILAPLGAKWKDVTEEVLPKDVHRDWYFQPRRQKDVVETAPYEQGSNGHWGPSQKRYDLVWRRGRFQSEQPHTRQFVIE